MKPVYDLVRIDFDPSLPVWAELPPNKQVEFGDLCAQLQRTAPTLGNAYEEAVAQALASVAAIEAETEVAPVAPVTPVAPVAPVAPVKATKARK